MSPPDYLYRVECGACGDRRVFRAGRHYSATGMEIGSVSPNGPNGVLDEPCPACGCTDRTKVARNWHGPHGSDGKPGTDRARWRYNGPGQPGKGWRVPCPDEDGQWPEPVQIADVHERPVVPVTRGICEQCASDHWAPCPHGFTCPTCNARPFAHCRRPSGHKAQELHAERVALARRHWTPEQLDQELAWEAEQRERAAAAPVFGTPEWGRSLGDLCACGHSRGTHAGPPNGNHGGCLDLSDGDCDCRGFREPGARPSTTDVPAAAADGQLVLAAGEPQLALF